MGKFARLALPSTAVLFLSSSNMEKSHIVYVRLYGRGRLSFGSIGFPRIINCTKIRGNAILGDEGEVEVAEGYTMTQFCDKVIDVFMNEKKRVKEWKKLLIFREEWRKYKDRFYSRCRVRAEMESDPASKQKFHNLASKVKTIDDEMEEHSILLTEIQDNPTDLNAIVARRRKDFTGEFFAYLSLVSETCDNLEDRDAIARLGSRCLSSVSSFDKTLENIDTLDIAQAKFDDILDSSSIEIACEKVKTLARTKQLDSSLVLLINTSWAAAKESKTMKNEVKEIMHRIYKATKSSLRSMAPKEIKLLKHLLNITDPEERFSALAGAFAPVDSEANDPEKDGLLTTPKELHKWIKVMADAYHLNKEDTHIREAKQLSDPIVMQRLLILKKTIEDEYLEKNPPSQTQEGDSFPSK